MSLAITEVGHQHQTNSLGEKLFQCGLAGSRGHTVRAPELALYLSPLCVLSISGPTTGRQAGKPHTHSFLHCSGEPPPCSFPGWLSHCSAILTHTNRRARTILGPCLGAPATLASPAGPSFRLMDSTVMGESGAAFRGRSWPGHHFCHLEHWTTPNELDFVPRKQGVNMTSLWREADLGNTCYQPHCSLGESGCSHSSSVPQAWGSQGLATTLLNSSFWFFRPSSLNCFQRYICGV